MLYLYSAILGGSVRMNRIAKNISSIKILLSSADGKCIACGIDMALFRRKILKQWLTRTGGFGCMTARFERK
jgi:hypothetical protein